MEDQIAFAPASVTDIPLLRQLAREIWHAHYPGIISREQIDYMLEQMYATDLIEREMKGGTRWELIHDSGQVAGFVSYAYEPACALVKLHKLYVRVDRHGRGLGRASLQRVLAWAREVGANEVSLFVNKHNEKAIRAYQRAGFVIAESVVNSFGGGYVMDDYRMVAKVR